MTTQTLTPHALSTFKSFQMPKLQDIEPEIFVKKYQMPAGVLATEADTLGWDTVNSIRLPVVNATLEKSSRYPKEFHDVVSENWNIGGRFNAWKLVRGGSGAIVFMELPMPEAHMAFNDQSLQFNDGSATIAIKLTYLPQEPTGKATAGKATDGKPQFLVANPQARSSNDPAVVIQSIDYGTSKPDTMMDTLFRGALSIWLNKNVNLFSYVFTVVNINALAAKEAFQWLKPTYTSYAYFNGPTDETSYFGVLNMTSGDSAEGLSNQLPPSSIPQGCNSALLISTKKFLNNMVLPGMSTAFPRASEGTFIVTGNNTVIEKVGNDVELDPIPVNGINYTPWLQDFTYQIVGDEMQVNTKVKVSVGLGIDVYIQNTGYYKIKLVKKPNGGGETLDFEESRVGKTNSWNEIATWAIVTDAIIAAITGCTAGIAKVMLKETLKRVVAYVIVAIIVGIIAAIPSIIAQVVQGKAAEVLPSIGGMVADATGDIKWPESTGFTPEKAEMNGSLQIGGKLDR
ncbi:TULIP family P47-like protein [Chitinophaga sp. G-6-1-13]|uniref:TULIP family P47-like protein n=1 Tax=Chitinophaga fulva TaxID=2728842 RepID=A0A848GJZ2_9BACT|nr:TULIP family P47-like protein [Chitinophaga fulva]NML37719.1 TULIP family P47-like protein [Chitinophaga fulva]